ncbi:hypothetical protein [Thermoleophilum album]|uniref:Uncharacterized protein n=1 Tax=Thermoleophilum album TaxID=29539 RepID=A0A1H6FKZ0_THEAL|nr:hypothetical protein [Thermoleophilum album]SEH10495.1 hypothetical protein SAMN02745716_0354 [Thermoleophilum album]
MAHQRVPDARLERALEALAEPGRFRAIEAQLAARVPQLERILRQALEEGGWFGTVHQAEVQKAAFSSDPDERLRRVTTLLQEETRIAMMVGVAVGFELARELELPGQASDSDPLDHTGSGDDEHGGG